MINLYHGDCIEIMQDVPSDSVDCVITDPPYGITSCAWDFVIPFDLMWKELIRITKKNSAILLFGTQPFTSVLITSNPKMYKYDWIWIKDRVTGVLNAKKQPLRCVENISVFYDNQPTYNPQGLELVNRKSGTGVSRAQQKRSATGKIKQTKTGYYLQENGNYPRQVLKFKNESVGLHPTQKPINLIEYLIKTYTNVDDTVLDFTMGSGTTGVACFNLGRRFIGIEKDEDFFDIASNRISKLKEPFFYI